MAHETARWSLLDAVKGQLQDRDQYTRMLIAFPISEDATLQTHLKQVTTPLSSDDFQRWSKI